MRLRVEKKVDWKFIGGMFTATFSIILSQQHSHQCPTPPVVAYGDHDKSAMGEWKPKKARCYRFDCHHHHDRRRSAIVATILLCDEEEHKWFASHWSFSDSVYFPNSVDSLRGSA